MHASKVRRGAVARTPVLALAFTFPWRSPLGRRVVETVGLVTADNTCLIAVEIALHQWIGWAVEVAVVAVAVTRLVVLCRLGRRRLVDHRVWRHHTRSECNSEERRGQDRAHWLPFEKRIAI